MKTNLALLQDVIQNQKVVLPLDSVIHRSRYCPVDLSVENDELGTFSLSNVDDCQRYLDGVLKKKDAKVAYGGYLEKRKLYEKANRFSKEPRRNIHLGMDFWCGDGTNVIAPIDGIVHSFNNNSDFGDYGPTIILEHHIESLFFYSLYGHLSIDSLEDLRMGQPVVQGSILGRLGTTSLNVGYAPHLHFQLIFNLQEHIGDYPGVCAEQDLDFYKTNCPDPNLMFHF